MSPYAPYEKSAPKQFIFIGKNYDEFYRRYDHNDEEKPQGSFFQNKDRARLIYTTLCTNLDMGLLKTINLLIAYMPFQRAV